MRDLIERMAVGASAFKLTGRFYITCYTPDGAGPLWTERPKNGIVGEGLVALLDGTLDPTALRLGLIGTLTTLAFADTMVSHSGWTEEHTSYSESTRPAWSPAAASAGSASATIINTTQVAYSFTSDTIVRGMFATTDSTKGGTSGTLWSTGALSQDRNVVTGQELRLFYELVAAAT